ncbi:GNAT family N-acetyltransferase (plasmid) [Pseudoalteromonas sp. T1lg65]|uniref:GNAT family N-acetyltransferase n=1 Tax=Pseudoalteromonas sp. T1lg65 TaxID=2077101 RepID=UPI003F7B06A5
MKPSDLEAVYLHRRDHVTAKYIGAPATMESAKARLDMACRVWAGLPQERLILAIERRCDRQLIGELVFKYLDETKQRGEIGFRLARAAIGQGFGYEAAQQFITELFSQFPVKLICAICAVENHQSKALMEKLRMEFKEVRKQCLELETGWHDGLVYEISKDEFSKRQNNLTLNPQVTA